MKPTDLKLEPKINPLIGWMIMVYLISTAGASVHLTGNYTGDGKISSYSEGKDHRLAAGATGPSELYLQVDMDGLDSSAFQGLNASQDGSFVARTPEYNLRVRDASEFHGTADLSRESEIEETRELIAEYNDTLVRTTRTVLTDAAVATSIRGNGQFSEDIDITTIGKARALKLREMDGNGSFNLTTDLTLSGVQIKRDFGLLNETEAFDRRVVMAYGVDEDGVITQPLGGV